MRKILHNFNMIEIVLAIGVVAFGVTAVMALLPPSLNANRDVSADAFAVEATSKVDALLELFIRPEWSKYLGESGSILKASDFKNNLDGTLSDNLKEINKYTAGENIFKADVELSKWNIFYAKNGSVNVPYVFFLESPDGAAAVQARLWKDSIDDIYSGGKDPNNGNGGKYNYDKAARIFIELSWPIKVSYANRQKRIIVKELYNM